MIPTPLLILEERDHSPLGPSSFTRSEICTASTLSEGRIKRTSGWADEGSVAHLVFELALKHKRSPSDWLGQIAESDSGEIEVDDEMVDHLTTQVAWVHATFPDGFEIERKLAMPLSRMFGYSDIFGIDAKGTFTVADLKYGSQYVGANEPQTGFYAAMALIERGINLSQVPDAAVVFRTVILQPRVGDGLPRDHHWTAGELRALLQRLHDLEAQLDRGEFTYQPGKHCRWCNRAANCPSLRLLVKDAAMASIAADPANPPTAASLDEAAGLLPAIEVWVKAVKEQLVSYVNAGGELQNARMIQGNNKRDWADANAAAMLMELYGVEPDMPGKLRSPAQAEKALPKAAKADVAALVTTTRGNPRLEVGPAVGTAVPPSLTALDMNTLVPMASKLLAKQQLTDDAGV